MISFLPFLNQVGQKFDPNVVQMWHFYLYLSYNSTGVFVQPLLFALKGIPHLKYEKKPIVNACKYSGSDIRFNACGSFKLSDSNEFGKNVIIFSADMSSSVHADNEKILGK